MSDNVVFEQEVRIAFENYLHTFFVERDYKKTVRLFHPQICGFGTAGDETAFSYEDSLSLSARDIAQCPDPIVYELAFAKVIELTDHVGVVMAGMNIAGSISDVPFRVDHLRTTAIFVKMGRRWLIQHLHLSQEQTNLSKGEAYPLKELANKTQLLEQMVSERTQELTKALKKIEMIAITDNLTGIYNRRKFDEVLAYEIQRTKRFGEPMSIILGDIDRFKKVNDRHGHLVGDEVLKIISRLFQNNLRQVDVLARWGGEEFIVLLPGTAGAEAVTTAEKLRQLVKKSQNEYQVFLTMSFGVAEYLSGDSVDTLLKKADLALYRAKGKGRNRVEME
ncbi:MAG: diguanylate cyclase [Firmicutes bacterium]|nr:diguanylate cyclase [Bacillota bacterium]